MCGVQVYFKIVMLKIANLQNENSCGKILTKLLPSLILMGVDVLYNLSDCKILGLPADTLAILPPPPPPHLQPQHKGPPISSRVQSIRTLRAPLCRSGRAGGTQPQKGTAGGGGVGN